MPTNRAVFAAIKTEVAANIGAAYTAVGTAFTDPLRMFRITNDTDGDCYFSLDGITDQIFLNAGSFVLYDVSGNSAGGVDFRVPAQTTFYVKEIVSPTTGLVYVEAIID